MISMALTILTSCSDTVEEPIRNITAFPAPSFDLPDLMGQNHRSDDLKGNPTILAFWTTWAPSAVMQLEDLKAVHQQYQEIGVKVIAVALDEDGIRDLELFSQHSEYPFTILIAPPDFHENFGGIDALPTTFVINSNWQIINRYTGRIGLIELSKEIDFLTQPKE